MLRVGITGGIGSGKSLVCKSFELLGIPVFYADDEVKKMYDDTPSIHEQLIATFGEDVYSNGILNKKQLAQKVFGNKEAVQQLNAIAHPAVAKRFLVWTEKQKNVPYVIEEAALIFESHADQFLNKVINVSASEVLRVKRVVLRDGATPDEVRQRMAHQLSDEERNTRADYTIINDENTPLLSQILRIHEELCK